MIKRAAQIARALWASIVSISALLGAVYLYPDVIGLPEAYGFRGWAVPPASATLFALLLLASGCITWMDVRPFALRWIEGRKRLPLEVVFFNEINEESKYGPNKRTPLLIREAGGKNALIQRIEYLVGLRNTLSDRTIYNAVLIVHLAGRPVIFMESALPVDGSPGQRSANIAPGQTIYFRLGVRHQTETISPTSVINISSAAFEELKKRADYEGFTLYGKENGGDVTLLRNDHQPLEIGIYGDDIPAKKAMFEINAKDVLSVIYLGLEDL